MARSGERKGRRGAARHGGQTSSRGPAATAGGRGRAPAGRPTRATAGKPTFAKGGKPGRSPSGRLAEFGKRPVASSHRSPKATAAKRERPVLPEVKVPAPSGPPRVGEWLLTTRPGAERDLIEELAYSDDKSFPRLVAPSLIAAKHKNGELAFARQGFVVGAVVPPAQVSSLLPSLLSQHGGKPQPWAMDSWVPDSDEGNLLSGRSGDLAEKTRVGGVWGDMRTHDARAAWQENGLYAQICLLPPGDLVAVGVMPVRDALSLAPGGRLRVHVPDAAPSRAAMKLLEAFAWLDRAPDPGDSCVDLGAAPGGWTWVLLERRARVTAVDPAFLARSLQSKKGVTHIRADAFTFEPREPVDWLFSDMAWRPLESAALLAKWARRGWARLLIANIKLPMKKKAEMLLRVREILDDGGWKNLRVRQLYHDREEVTVAGVRL